MNGDSKRTKAELLSELRKLERRLTELSQYRLELEGAVQQLRMEKELLGAIVANLPGLVVVIDESGNILQWNDTFRRMSGYFERELRQMHLLDLLAGEDAQSVDRALCERSSKTDITLEARLLCKDGSRRFHRFLARHMVACDAKVTVLMGIDTSLRNMLAPSAEMGATTAERFALLSPRQREVMQLIVAGRPNKMIAHDLRISTKTVEMHRAKLMKKLGTTSVVELVRLVFGAERQFEPRQGDRRQ